MKLRQTLFAIISALCLGAGVFPLSAQPSNLMTTAPVYVPDSSHAGEPLPDGIIAWDAIMKTVTVTNEQESTQFSFSFTNIAVIHETTLATNFTLTANITTLTNWTFFGAKKITFTTNFISSTNITENTNGVRLIPTTILSVHPSCGCTTAEMPPVPWTLPAGSNGTVRLTVNLQGKSGLPGQLFKTVNVATDKGSKTLSLIINVLPPPPMRPMSEEERAKGVSTAKLDRQAVFKGDCASCHARKIEGKYGPQLFNAICTICHEANPRATMVPDLHNLPAPTSEEFWRTWITAGKAGTLMPAFAQSQGGPLNDLQIASLATYLNTLYPSHVLPPATK